MRRMKSRDSNEKMERETGMVDLQPTAAPCIQGAGPCWLAVSKVVVRSAKDTYTAALAGAA